MLPVLFLSLWFLADVGDANQLAHLCRGVNEARVSQDEMFDLRECYGYVLGVTEALATYAKDDEQICFPNGVTQRQLARIFLKYAEEHPKILHLHRAHVLRRALMDAFPCASRDE